MLQLKQDWVALNLMQASSPELMDAFVSLIENDYKYDGLELQEKLQIEAVVRVQIHNWSNAYYQFRVGTLNKEQWNPLVRDIDKMSKFSHFWETWDGWEQIFDDEFRYLIKSRRPKE